MAALGAWQANRVFLCRSSGAAGTLGALALALSADLWITSRGGAAACRPPALAVKTGVLLAWPCAADDERVLPPGELRALRAMLPGVQSWSRLRTKADVQGSRRRRRAACRR